MLFADIQVVATPEAEPVGSDLNALVPLLSSQLALAGGTKLPGGIRKWSSLNPPEIRAVVQGGAGVSVTLTTVNEAKDAPGLPHTWTSNELALVADIKALALPDGNYEVSLQESGKTIHQSILRLRSSNSPDPATRTVAALAHDLSDDPLAVLRATPLRARVPADAVVRGPSSRPERTPTTTANSAGTDIWWNAPKPSPPPPPPPITLAALDPTSCMATGAHYIELPPAYGPAKWGLVNGVCKYCGLTKRYPARIRWHRDGTAASSKQGTPLSVNVSHLPPVTPGYSDWDIAFDSLVHVHGGSYRTLEFVADQVEGSTLFTDTFSRSLEVRGDLEVERGADLVATRWELSPAYLAELATGEFLLTGCWSRDDRDALRELVEKTGGTLISERDQHGPARQLVIDVSIPDLEHIATMIGTAGVVPDAAARLVDTLPSLDDLEAALPRIPLPPAKRVLRFDLGSASWQQVTSATAPGAYRLEQAFGRTDVFRTPEDVNAGTVALATVQLSKHLAARRSGRALLAYSPHQQVLAVPLGADLPGLYGRAAVLCGGRLPMPDGSRRVLLYHHVPQRVADGLNSLLCS